MAKISGGPNLRAICARRGAKNVINTIEKNAPTKEDVNAAVSANGTTNGIVWAVENSSPAVLHAFDATTLQELYNSNQAANSRDHFGNGNKFITPLVVNGKVFVGTPSAVAIFGLLP